MTAIQIEGLSPVTDGLPDINVFGRRPASTGTAGNPECSSATAAAGRHCKLNSGSIEPGLLRQGLRYRSYLNGTASHRHDPCQAVFGNKEGKLVENLACVHYRQTSRLHVKTEPAQLFILVVRLERQLQVQAPDAFCSAEYLVQRHPEKTQVIGFHGISGGIHGLQLVGLAIVFCRHRPAWTHRSKALKIAPHPGGYVNRIPAGDDVDGLWVLPQAGVAPRGRRVARGGCADTGDPCPGIAHIGVDLVHGRDAGPVFAGEDHQRQRSIAAALPEIGDGRRLHAMDKVFHRLQHFQRGEAGDLPRNNGGRSQDVKQKAVRRHSRLNRPDAFGGEVRHARSAAVNLERPQQLLF